MTLLAQIAQLNLSYGFVRLLPQAGARTRTVVLFGYLVTATAGAMLATIFLTTSLSASIVPRGLAPALLFLISVVLWTIFVIQDGVLTGLRRAFWVPAENLLFGAGKLLLLPAFAVLTVSEGIFLSWTVPVVIAVAAVNGLLFLRVMPHRPVGREQTRSPAMSGWRARPVASFLSAQYVVSVSSAAGNFLVPLIIIKRLGADANAHFYLPWLVGIAFSNLLGSVVASFVVEVSHHEDPFRQTFWHAVRLMVGVAFVGFVLTVVAGPLLLRLLSRDYADAGSTLLRLIGLAFPFSVVMALFTASLWIRQRFWLLAGFEFAQTAILIGLTYVFLDGSGINAPGIGNLVSDGVLALLILPAIIRWYRHQSDGFESTDSMLWLDPKPPT